MATHSYILALRRRSARTIECSGGVSLSEIYADNSWNIFTSAILLFRCESRNWALHIIPSVVKRFAKTYQWQFCRQHLLLFFATFHGKRRLITSNVSLFMTAFFRDVKQGLEAISAMRGGSLLYYLCCCRQVEGGHVTWQVLEQDLDENISEANGFEWHVCSGTYIWQIDLWMESFASTCSFLARIRIVF